MQLFSADAKLSKKKFFDHKKLKKTSQKVAQKYSKFLALYFQTAQTRIPFSKCGLKNHCQ